MSPRLHAFLHVINKPGDEATYVLVLCFAGSMPKVVSIFIEQIRQHIHGE